MSTSDVEDHYDKERRAGYHQTQLSGSNQKTGETAQILNTLSEIDDLPVTFRDDPVMGQLVSKLTSTSNLTSEEVESNRWLREIVLVLWLCRYPTEDGCHGSWRGYAHGDQDAALDPIKPEKRMAVETYVMTSNLALSRSEDAKVIEEGTRDVKESIVNEGEQSSGGGGLRAKLGL